MRNVREGPGIARLVYLLYKRWHWSRCKVPSHVSPELWDTLISTATDSCRSTAKEDTSKVEVLEPSHPIPRPISEAIAHDLRTWHYPRRSTPQFNYIVAIDCPHLALYPSHRSTLVSIAYTTRCQSEEVSKSQSSSGTQRYRVLRDFVTHDESACMHAQFYPKKH